MASYLRLGEGRCAAQGWLRLFAVSAAVWAAVVVVFFLVGGSDVGISALFCGAGGVLGASVAALYVRPRRARRYARRPPAGCSSGARSAVSAS